MNIRLFSKPKKITEVNYVDKTDQGLPYVGPRFGTKRKEEAEIMLYKDFVKNKLWEHGYGFYHNDSTSGVAFYIRYKQDKILCLNSLYYILKLNFYLACAWYYANKNENETANWAILAVDAEKPCGRYGFRQKDLPTANYIRAKARARIQKFKKTSEV